MENCLFNSEVKLGEMMKPVFNNESSTQIDFALLT